MKNCYKIIYGLLTGDIISYNIAYTHATSDKQAISNLEYRLGKDKNRLRDIKLVIVKPKRSYPSQHTQLSMF